MTPKEIKDDLAQLPMDVWRTDVYGKPCPRKDPHEFVKEYAAKSGVPVRELFDTDLRVVYCPCCEEGCCGWQMQTQEWVEQRKRLGLLPDFTKAHKPKEVYRGETPEEYYAIHYPDMDKESLAICLAGDASTIVCTLSCECGRRHEIEYTPPPHEWYASGQTCACGRQVVYGE